MTMSSPPNSPVAVPTKRSPKSGAVTLPAQMAALPPAAVISSTTACAGAVSRSLTTTLAPSRARVRAMERPMPRPDPLTIAVLPSSFPMMIRYSFSQCRFGWSVERDDGGAEKGDGVVGERDLQIEGGATFAADVVDRGDGGGARGLSVHGGDGGEPYLVGAKLLLR